MYYSNINFTVCYVDPSIETGGDGATPATAMKNLPWTASGLSSGTCYLIRRTGQSFETRLPNGENSGITSLLILGMPKKNDELYAIIPAEARTAWGEDEVEYANVKADTGNEAYGESKALSLPNCLVFLLHRISLYRDGQDAWQNAIELHHDGYRASIAVERCRFGLRGICLADLSAESGAQTHAVRLVSGDDAIMLYQQSAQWNGHSMFAADTILTPQGNTSVLFYTGSQWEYRDARGEQYRIGGIPDNGGEPADGMYSSMDETEFELTVGEFERQSALNCSTGMFISARRPQVFTARHCRIDLVSSTGYFYEARSYAFRVDNAVFLSVSDLDVWVTTTQAGDYMGSGDPVLQFSTWSGSGGGTYTGATGNYENISFHIFVKDGNGGIPALFRCHGHDFASVRNVSVGMDSRFLGSGTPSKVAVTGRLISCTEASEFCFRDISVNLPYCWRINSGCQAVQLTGRSGDDAPGASKVVKDISVILGESDGIDTQNGGNYYNDMKDGDSSHWQYYAALLLDFYSSGSSGCEPVIADGMTVTHPRGQALYARNIWLKNTALEGTVRVSNAVADITSLSTWYPGHAVGLCSCSTMRIGTLTLGKGNIPGSDGDMAVIGTPQESRSFLFVGTSNGQLMADGRSGSESHGNCYAVACANEQDEGHYTMRTINAMCNTWGVARSGSPVTASLKLSNNTAEGKGFLSLGRLPFGGFSLAASGGRGKLVLYAAAKGLPELAELPRRVIVQVSVPRGDGTSETLFSSTDGVWHPDGSSWIGEAGLSPYRLEIPMFIPGNCDVDVKIHFSWYSAAGYLYIDPGMSIIQEE